MDVAQSFQVAPPDSFVFSKPNEWPKWIRSFERFRLASGIDSKHDAMHVNAMSDDADDIMGGGGFGLTEKEIEIASVNNKFDGHFVIRRIAIVDAKIREKL